MFLFFLYLIKIITNGFFNMKKQIIAIALIFNFFPVFAADTNPTLEQRVDQLETDSIMQSIKWGGIFEYRYDSIQSKTLGSESSFTPMRIKALLDASTHTGARVQYYTRFGLEKYTNDYVNQGAAGTNTLDGSRVEKGVSLKLERAYINYSVTRDVVVSAGRLPTIDGPPSEMYDNSPRLGTYPLLAYGAILDGLALSYNWGFLPEQYKFATRFIYTPLYNVSFDATNAGNIAKPTYDAGGGPGLQEKATMYSVMADFETKMIPLFSNFSFIAQSVHFQNLHIADTIGRGTDLSVVLSSPALGGNGIPAAGTAGAVFTGSTERFSFSAHTVNSTMKNIANSNVSLGLTGLYTTAESKGLLESSANVLNALNSTASGAALAKKLGIGRGVMTDNADKTTSGSTVLVTATYITPFSSINSPLIGAEYLHGTKGVLYFGFTADDITSFYSTRGNGYHVFWTQPLATGTTLRTGYMLQDHQFSKGYIGAPTTTDLLEKTLYLNLRYVF
jgi:hypothetical protein